MNEKNLTHGICPERQGWFCELGVAQTNTKKIYVEQTDILTYMYEEYYTLGRDWSHPDLIPSFSSLAPATVTGEAKVVFLSLEDLTRRGIHQVFKNG